MLWLANGCVLHAICDLPPGPAVMFLARFERSIITVMPLELTSAHWLILSSQQPGGVLEQEVLYSYSHTNGYA